MPYTLIDTVEKVLELLRIIRNYRGNIWGDIESTGLDWFVHDILLFQLKIGDQIYVIDVRGLGYDSLKAIVEAIEDTGNRIGFHNAKFDLKFLRHRTGVMLSNIICTMILETLLYSGIEGKQRFSSLEDLAIKYTDVFMEKGTRKEFINFPADKPFTEKMFTYSALDVFVLGEIFEAQMNIARDTRQEKVVILEMDLVPVVAKMEYDGIRVDVAKWLELEKKNIDLRDRLYIEFRNEIIDFIISLKYDSALELVQATHLLQKNKFTKKTTAYLQDIKDFNNFRGWVDEHFNVKSSLQMVTVFNLMGIKTPSTNEKILEAYKEYPIVGKLLDIRGVNKSIDQYGSNFLKSIHPVTGKIHTEYIQTGTRTGRFSSEKPNLQNIPVKGGYRECFLPEDNFLFAPVDYSQEEYRLTGAVSGDKVIIQAYKEGLDMHTATARIVSGKTGDVTKDERQMGKTMNFALLYGSSEWGLKKNLKIPIERAKELIKSFWTGYPTLSKFMEIVGVKILDLGYSCTPFGRRRYLEPKPVYGNAHDFMMWKERALREGRNHIIQGGGADIIKLAMVRIAKENPFEHFLILTLQVHDEIVAQVHKDIAEEGLAFIKRIMIEEEQKFLGEIPAAVDGELKEVWSK